MLVCVSAIPSLAKTGLTVEELGDCLDDYVTSLHKDRSATGIDIPLRSDGSEYSIDDLAEDQKEALAVVIEKVKAYCDCDPEKPNTTLRLTVSGVAGSGKSTWINTLVTMLRKLFSNTDTVGVFGPTGSAAFNAGGETINRGFRVPITVKSLDIDGKKDGFLLRKFNMTVCLIIDERSMVEADKLGCVQHYMSKRGHGGRRKGTKWGGIPIVILVGDDYQIPSIGYGAFYALDQATIKEPAKVNACQIKCRRAGFEEFLEFGKNVLYLNGGVKRVNADQEQLRRILLGLRCEDEGHVMSREDIQRLLELDINHPSFTREQREDIKKKSMYLFANKEPRDAYNSTMLLKANMQGNPVARLKSRTTDKHGKQVANSSHFDCERCPYQLMICKTAQVALNGCNIEPSIGLYHGTLGVVEDIVFKENESPNLDDLPAYVLVNFNQYCGKQIVEGSKTSVPITPREARCKIGCCTRRYIPLALAYGKTVHTFQGQSVGPVPAGRPENAIQKIIVEPGTRAFEGNNVGLFYTTVSRATTIGTEEDKKSSAIYFDGPDFSEKRITQLTKDMSGKFYRKALLRKKWVDYQKTHSLKRREYTKEEMAFLFNWIKKTRYTFSELEKIIVQNDANKA
jgi:AAA domain